jgi:hypothetical protein
VNRLPTLTPHLEDQSTTYDADRRSDRTPNNSRFSHIHAANGSFKPS